MAYGSAVPVGVGGVANDVFAGAAGLAELLHVSDDSIVFKAQTLISSGFANEREPATKHTHHPPSPIPPPVQLPNQSPTAPTAPKAHKTTSSSTPTPFSHPPSPAHRPVSGKAKAAAAETQQPPCPPQPRGRTRGTPRRAARGTWDVLCSTAGVASMAARRWSHGGCRLVCLRVHRSEVVGSRVGRNCWVGCQFCELVVSDVWFACQSVVAWYV